jgi:Fungalysin metallopeptidase (M36)/Fungalysin/Thermolysin Propeptide Motif
MDFASPRFVGNDILLEILNDPDTGQRKLGKGSDVDAVRRVQQALFDLGWSLLISEPVADEEKFVDGDYGPATSETVVTYKTHYGLRFPPNDPNGIIDGFTGPRTLRNLDPQCVLLDEASAAIDARVQELQAAGVTVEAADGTRIFDDTPGAFRTATITGADGALFFRRGIGAFEVHGAIFASYTAEHGSAEGELGYPVSDEHEDGPRFLRSDFENGSLRFDRDTGLVEVVPSGPEPVPPPDRTFEVDLREELDDATLEERLASARAQLAQAPQDARMLPEGAVASVDALTGNPDRVVFNAVPEGEPIDRAHAQATGVMEALTVVGSPELQKGDVIETAAGMQSASLTQTHASIPVYDAGVAVHVRPDGAIVEMLGSVATVPGAPEASPQLEPADALALAAQHLAANGAGVPDQIAFTPSGAPAPDDPRRLTEFDPDPAAPVPATAALTWFPLAPDDLRLAWETFVMASASVEGFRTLVDASDGSILLCTSLARQARARATLFRTDPGHPPAATREMPGALSEYPAQSRTPLPSPFPREWVDTNSTEGPAVSVRPRTPTGGFDPPVAGRAGADGVVFFPQQAPDLNGVLVHAFYFCNRAHDFFYVLGFREADGAFQRDPDFRAVLVSVFGTSQRFFAQEGAFNPEGTRVGIDAGVALPIPGATYNPDRDHHCGADGSVIFHEYTHAVFHRLVGMTKSPQTDALNEGIADFFACSLTDDTKIGAYSAAASGQENLRKHEYTSLFPFGFEKLPSFPAGVDAHDVGEIWAAAMLDVGRSITRQLALQLAVDAMKLARGSTPGFLDMRNALFSAASGMLVRAVRDPTFAGLPEALFAQPLMWQVFARYGMGPRATSTGKGFKRVQADQGTTGPVAHVSVLGTTATPGLGGAVPARVADTPFWIASDPAGASLRLHNVELSPTPRLVPVASVPTSLNAISALATIDGGLAAYDAASGTLAFCTLAPDGSGIDTGQPLTLPRAFSQLVSAGPVLAGYDDTSGEFAVFGVADDTPVELGGTNLGAGQLALPFPIGGDPGVLLVDRASGSIGQVVVDAQSGFAGFGEGGRTLADATLAVPLALDGRQFLLAYRDADGVMQIDAVDAAGELETAMASVWTRGWTSVVPIELMGHAALISYKAGSGAVEVGLLAS